MVSTIIYDKMLPTDAQFESQHAGILLLTSFTVDAVISSGYVVGLGVYMFYIFILEMDARETVHGFGLSSIPSLFMSSSSISAEHSP